MYCTSEKGTQYWTQQLNERKYLPYSFFNQCMCKGAMPRTLGRALGNLQCLEATCTHSVLSMSNYAFSWLEVNVTLMCQFHANN